MKKVVHCKKDSYDVYIGRPSIFGNPWTHTHNTNAEFIVESREQAVKNYRLWLAGDDFTDILQDRRSKILDALPGLKGKILGCWCSPQVCHGDVLISMIDGG